MAEENNQEPKTLEEITGSLDRIDGINRKLKAYNDAVQANVDPKERASLIQELASFVHGYKAEEHGYDSDERKRFEAEMKEYAIGSDAVNTRVGETLGTTFGRIAQDYKARIDEMAGAIVEKYNKSMEGAKDKVMAYLSIAYGFFSAFGGNKLTQEGANESFLARLANYSGAQTNFADHRGDIDSETTFGYRFTIDRLELVKENIGEDGNVTYSLDKEKIKSLIEGNPVVGATLYTAKEPERSQAA
jgi:hypothetical protein